MKWILLLVILSESASYAMDEQEFQARSAALKSQQSQTEALMKRLGAGVGFTNAIPSQSSQESSERSPLFQVHGDLTRAFLPEGKLISGKLMNRLVVGPEGSPVLIELDTQQGWLSGLRMKGVARQGGTEGRITLELGKLLFKSGKSVAMQGVVLDDSGAYGLEAEVLSGKTWAVLGAMASSFISGFAASQQSQVPNAFGFTTPDSSGRNGMLQGVSQTAADQSKRLIDDATKEKPILIVPLNTPVTVLIQQEVRL